MLKKKDLNLRKKLSIFFNKIINIHRSITGRGVLKTLNLISKELSCKIKVKTFKSGKKVFDWKVPLQWEIKDSYIITPENKKICEFKKNNLHIMAYSMPYKNKMTLAKLKKKLFSLPEQPNAIPYVTSYYKKDWGFCISHDDKKKLKKGKYQVVINSKLFKGKLNYGELYIKGKSKKEIFFSTYICHPSMANNETSGLVVATFISKWLMKRKNRFSYRFIFVPETIGSICYIKKNLKILKKNMIAGYNLTCLGGRDNFTFLPSINGNTIADIYAKKILEKERKKVYEYTWLDRGSDERQYCSPGIDLPVCSIFKSKYEDYKEYHTSLDKFNTVVTSKNLLRSIDLYKKIILDLEKIIIPISTNQCEPFFTKYNLYPTTSIKTSYKGNFKLLRDIISYCNGKRDLYMISKKLNIEVKKLFKYIKVLNNNKLLKLIN